MAYIANPVNFDGTNDSCSLTGTLTGSSDSTAIILFSVWLRILGATGGIARRLLTINTGSTVRFAVHRSSGGNLAISGRNSSSTAILDAEITTGSPADTAWYHLLISLNMANAAQRAIWLNGADIVPTWNTYNTAETLGLAPGTTPTCKIGNSASAAGGEGTGRWIGDMADLYFATPGSWFDPSSGGNIAKFISGGGPVNLGSDGSAPLGSAPLVYMSGATVDWHTNKGTGGGFTEVGALEDGAVALPVGVPIYTQTKFRLYSNTGSGLGP